MTINPRDYDLRELRRMANPEEDALPASRGSAASRAGASPANQRAEQTPEQVDRFNQRRELLMLEAESLRAGTGTEKPYLERMPTTYAAEVVVFEWLDLLIDKAGFKATGDALSYYERIGWVTEGVKERLRTYMRGFSEVSSYDPDSTGPRELAMNDHVTSLVYIARLAAME